jgi:hypothetical protein
MRNINLEKKRKCEMKIKKLDLKWEKRKCYNELKWNKMIELIEMKNEWNEIR